MRKHFNKNPMVSFFLSKLLILLDQLVKTSKHKLGRKIHPLFLNRANPRDFRVCTYTFILSSQRAIVPTKVINKEQMQKLNIQLPRTDTKEFTARLYLYNNKN
jgi:hypothetical protein